MLQPNNPSRASDWRKATPTWPACKPARAPVPGEAGLRGRFTAPGSAVLPTWVMASQWIPAMSPCFCQGGQAKISGPPLGGLQARGWAEEGARGGSTEGLAVEEGAAAVRVKEQRGEKTVGCQKRKWICCRVWRKDILILIHCLFKCWINMEVHSCQEQYLFASFALFYTVILLTPRSRWLFWSAIPCPGSALSPCKDHIASHFWEDVILNLPLAVAKSGMWLMAVPAVVLQPACAGRASLGPCALLPGKAGSPGTPGAASGGLSAHSLQVRQAARHWSRQRRGRGEERVELRGFKRSKFQPCLPIVLGAERAAWKISFWEKKERKKIFMFSPLNISF